MKRITDRHNLSFPEWEIVILTISRAIAIAWELPSIYVQAVIEVTARQSRLDLGMKQSRQHATKTSIPHAMHGTIF